MSEGLKACPFCGSEDVIVRHEKWAQCKSCLATGPVKEMSEEAATAWNTRAGEMA